MYVVVVKITTAASSMNACNAFFKRKKRDDVVGFF